MPSPERYLTRDEISTVLAWLKKKHHRSVPESRRKNLVIFRLSCCCGLRSKEIRLLQVRDFIPGARPVIRVRDDATKGSRGRTVRLWWDQGTYEDLLAWWTERAHLGPTAPFVSNRNGDPMSRTGLSEHWWAALRPLGDSRRKQLSIHSGRHTFCTAANWSGRSLDEIRDAMGHRSLATTSIYAHGWDREGLPDLFA